MTNIEKLASEFCVCKNEWCKCSEAFKAGYQAAIEHLSNKSTEVDMFHPKKIWDEYQELNNEVGCSAYVSGSQHIQALASKNAKIAELESENSKLKSDSDYDHKEYKRLRDDLKSQLTAKTEAVEKLVNCLKVLRGYSRHNSTCDLLVSSYNDCTCNFTKVVEMYDNILTKHAKG